MVFVQPNDLAKDTYITLSCTRRTGRVRTSNASNPHLRGPNPKHSTSDWHICIQHGVVDFGAVLRGPFGPSTSAGGSTTLGTRREVETVFGCRRPWVPNDRSNWTSSRTFPVTSSELISDLKSRPKWPHSEISKGHWEGPGRYFQDFPAPKRLPWYEHST